MRCTLAHRLMGLGARLTIAAIAGLIGGVDPVQAAPPSGSHDMDPYLWLEDIEGARALQWVDRQNATTAQELEAQPHFAIDRARAATILNDKRRLALPEDIHGDRLFNFWQDADHVRGLWRWTDLASYVAGTPQWSPLLDLDALSRAEKRTWVWKGAVCLKPDAQRCLVGLSDGGKDELEWREYDLRAGQFVPDGFYIPPAKSVVTWIDRDHLLLRSDFGPDSLTQSGYGRQVKIWRRGTPLSDARLIFSGEKQDVWATPYAFDDGAQNWPIIERGRDFWRRSVFHLTPDGQLVRSPLPETAELMAIVAGHAVALLHEDWTHGRDHWPAGALVAYPIAPLLQTGTTRPDIIFTPSASQAIEHVIAAGPALYVQLLDNVAGRVHLMTPREEGGWQGLWLALPPDRTIQLLAAGGPRHQAIMSVEGLVTPRTLYAATPPASANRQGGDPPDASITPFAHMPAFFDASSMIVTQDFATSRDGTRIPYFLVRPKNAQGPIPTLMHAYGGFRIPTLPTYLSSNPPSLGPLAQFWVERGGAFVLANIRGGGEFGPAWHKAALREGRQRAFDDLHAIAEALKDKKVTSQLAISGRSNGGLLVGVAMTQRPDLYDAVLMGVPLADMKRYDKLLAGASWVGEYGDPDKAEDWAFLSRYSPYQNIRPDISYPPIMIYTSTRDDRVHPGHARKMAARLAEQGTRVSYYENRRGGHAGSADKTERAYRAALALAFLEKEIGAGLHLRSTPEGEAARKAAPSPENKNN